MGVSAHLQISANNFATESFLVYMYYCKDKKTKHKAKTYDSKKVISEVTSSRREKEGNREQEIWTWNIYRVAEGGQSLNFKGINNDYQP